MRSLVPEISVCAVAITGRFVAFSKCLVSWRPMPREEGDVKIHG